MWQRLFGLQRSHRTNGAARPSGRQRSPHLECLEGRQLLSTTVTEFPIPTPNVTPFGAVLGADGNIWFSESPSAKVARVTPDGTITEFPIPSGATSFMTPAVGSDGNLWLIAQKFGPNGDVEEAVRVTMAGVVSEFPFQPLTGTFAPQSLTLGPDGNLWFPENGAIGRVSPAGAVTQYALPSQLSGLGEPGPMTVGPDGNLWFVEPGKPVADGGNGGVAVRMTTAGVFTGFPIPGLAGARTPLTVGPDGNLWFIESVSPGEVGRLTTTGVVTVFPTPSAFAGGSPLTVGPDGNLWFSESAHGAIARITTSGTVTEFLLPSLPSGFEYPSPGPLTVGPDGNLWFPAQSENRIGEITPSGAITAVTFPLTGYTPVGAPLVNGSDGDLWFIAIPTGGTQGAFHADIVRVNLAPVPVVNTVIRSGIHMHPTRLSLTFNRPMDATTVQDVGNYAIIPVDRRGRPLRPHERPIAIASAAYNSGTQTVTLTTARRLNIHRYYELTVTSTGPRGVADIDGTPLGGAGAGPFQTVLHRFSATASGRAPRSAARRRR